MKSQYQKSRLGLGMAALMFVFLASGAQAGSPTSTIERFNAALLDVMQKAAVLKFDGRYESLEPVLLSSFDMDFMAEFSAGRHWRKLSTDERQTLVGTFGRLWVSTYADRFDGYSGEAFEIVGEQKAPRNTILVKTNIVKSSGEKVSINYLMRERNNDWAVIDIFLKGKFSELAKQRSEYTSVLKREGISGLVAKVEAKVARMAQKDG